jgi:spectrin beta
MMEIDEMKKQYELMASTLLEWIHAKIAELQEDFTRSLPVVQKEMLRFKHFRTVEKPPK